MKVSQLIKALQEAQAKHGDLPVVATSIDSEIRFVSVLSDGMELSEAARHKADAKADEIFLES